MADNFIIPRVRAILVCHSFIEHEETRIFDLLGVRTWMEADTFPFVPTELWAYILFSSARQGRYPGFVSILNEQSNKMQFMGEIEPEFEADGEFLPTCVPIRCSFPQPGQDMMQVSFFQPTLEKVDSIKGEIPFWVYEQG